MTTWSTPMGSGQPAHGDTLEILGVRIADRTLEQAVDELAACAPGRAARHFCFVNAHCLNLACADAAYGRVLRRAHRVYGDGTGVRWASKRLGRPVADNVNGTDLFPLLWERAAREGLTLFFYGARPGVVRLLVSRMTARHGAAPVVGVHHGYGDEAEVRAAIAAASPDIVLVGLGAPAQDLWIDRYRTQLPAGALIGVGGLFDYYSGLIPRAPRAWRRLGVEWGWRLLQEPGRLWRRYLVGNPLFLARVLRFGRARPR